MTYATERIPRHVGMSVYDILRYTTTGAHVFTKADYPGLRAVLVECQGGGGGSGGCALTAAAEAAAGGGGGGGGYARSLIQVDDLDVTEAITVAVGGTAAAAGANAGGTGGDSIFDTISGEVRGVGGVGGSGQASTATTPRAGANGGAGGSGTGQLVVRGSNGSTTIINVNSIPRAKGGSSFMGGAPDENATTTGAAGTAGLDYGGGASGSMNCDSQGTAKAGSAGGDGIVIVTLYV